MNESYDVVVVGGGAAGVWVAGNLASLQAQVITSAAAGLSAGAAINADLAAEDADRAVAAARNTGRPARR